jgi:hypothetical protein
MSIENNIYRQKSINVYLLHNINMQARQYDLTAEKVDEVILYYILV